ncbi:hypothetical protein Vadar_031773 [Vaccinium darrowii]|uniref:Uncharacterized protein n=1 Tax=Vaccinium darrowii TaxID=229202 RepID=A0ACB7Z0L7_9ERIC|nr:hypothetical protein Vadar_031773 [Vaccinium darrowii]
MRSMPLYTQLSKSALGFRDLMTGKEDPQHCDQHNNLTNNNLPLILRRSRSERTESVTTFDDLSTTHGSIVGVAQKKGPTKKASSLLSESDCSNVPKGKKKKGKASSVICGAEIIKEPKERGRKGKASSLVHSITSFENGKSGKPPSLDQSKEKVSNDKPNDPEINHPAQLKPQDKALTKHLSLGPPMEKPISKPNGFEFGGPKGSSTLNEKYIYRAPSKPQSFWSELEVGPSPSEVAAVMAREREKEMGRYPFDDNQSSLLDGWTVDESMEGLQSKLERWRTELPPLYDRGGFPSSSFRSTSQHIQRDTDDESGLFSCFRNIYGYECQCICGKPPERKRSLSFSGRF